MHYIHINWITISDSSNIQLGVPIFNLLGRVKRVHAHQKRILILILVNSPTDQKRHHTALVPNTDFNCLSAGCICQMHRFNTKER